MFAAKIHLSQEGNAMALRTSCPATAVGTSPYGPDDEIGRLNMITPESRSRLLARVDPARYYDLSVDYFMGMPTWAAAGDPTYQIWMSHTPPGTVIDNLTGQTREINQHIGYSGDVFSMYTHCGTHIDTLNHWGYDGEIWNHFTAQRTSRQPALDEMRRRQMAADHRPRGDAGCRGDQRRGDAARQLPDYARGSA